MKNDTVKRPSVLVWWALVALVGAAFCGCDTTTVLREGTSWEPRPGQDRAAELVWNTAFGMAGPPPGVAWVDVGGKPDECYVESSSLYPDRSNAYGWWADVDGKRRCKAGDTVEGDYYSQVAVDDRFGVRKFYQTMLPHEWCHIMAVVLDGDGDRYHTGRCATVGVAPAPGGKMALAYELLVQEDL